jgi:hypothetical protein
VTVIYRHTDGRRVVRSRPEPMLEASPRWTRVASSQPDPDDGHPCGDCDFVAKTAGGLSFHRNAKHEREE